MGCGSAVDTQDATFSQNSPRYNKQGFNMIRSNQFQRDNNIQNTGNQTRQRSNKVQIGNLDYNRKLVTSSPTHNNQNTSFNRNNIKQKLNNASTFQQNRINSRTNAYKRTLYGITKTGNSIAPRDDEEQYHERHPPKSTYRDAESQVDFQSKFADILKKLNITEVGEVKEFKFNSQINKKKQPLDSTQNSIDSERKNLESEQARYQIPDKEKGSKINVINQNPNQNALQKSLSKGKIGQSNFPQTSNTGALFSFYKSSNEGRLDPDK